MSRSSSGSSFVQIDAQDFSHGSGSGEQVVLDESGAAVVAPGVDEHGHEHESGLLDDTAEVEAAFAQSGSTRELAEVQRVRRSSSASRSRTMLVDASGSGELDAELAGLGEEKKRRPTNPDANNSDFENDIDSDDVDGAEVAKKESPKEDKEEIGDKKPDVVPGGAQSDDKKPTAKPKVVPGGTQSGGKGGGKLHQLAWQGDLAGLDEHLKSHPDAKIDEPDDDKYTPLNIAAAYGHVEVVEALHKLGADIETHSASGYTPVHSASDAGRLAVIKYLIKAGADLEDKEPSGYNPFQSAARNGHVDCSRALLEAGVDREAVNKYGGAACLHASINGHPKSLRYLVEHCDVNHARHLDNRTPVCAAAYEGNFECVQILFDAGANIETRDETGANPLQAACDNGRLDIVKYLLSKGAAVNSSNSSGVTPLESASRSCHMHVVRYLLEQDAVEPTDAALAAILVASAKTGDAALAEYALSQGVQVDTPDHTGKTAGQWAIDLNQEEMVTLLARRGANLFLAAQELPRDTKGVEETLHRYSETDEYSPELNFTAAPYMLEFVNSTDDPLGRTPLHLACRSGTLRWIEGLLERNADPMIRSRTGGWLPIHECCETGQFEGLLCLLEHSKPEDAEAMIHAETGNGKTPLEIARRSKAGGIVEELRNRGARSYFEQLVQVRLPRYLSFFGSMLAIGPFMVGSFVVGLFKYPSLGEVPIQTRAMFGHRSLYFATATIVGLLVMGSALFASDIPSDNPDAIGAIVALYLFLLLGFQVAVVTKAWNERKYSYRFVEVTYASRRMRFTKANAIGVTLLFIEFFQQVGFSFSAPNSYIQWNQDVPVDDIGRGALGDFPSLQNENLNWASMYGSITLALAWHLIASYLTMSLLVFRDRKLQKKYPFIKSDFYQRIPNADVIVPLLSSAAFPVILANLLKPLDCTYSKELDMLLLDANPKIVCWRGQHLTSAIVALWTLFFYTPSAGLFSLYFMDESDTDLDLKFVALFEIIASLFKMIQVAASVFLSSYATVQVSLVLFADTALLLFTIMVQPCPHIMMVNIWRGASFTASLWAAVSVLISAAYDDPETIIPVVILFIGWVFCVISVIYSFIDSARAKRAEGTEMSTTLKEAMASVPGASGAEMPELHDDIQLQRARARLFRREEIDYGDATRPSKYHDAELQA